jgi:hypothetical protein
LHIRHGSGSGCLPCSVHPSTNASAGFTLVPSANAISLMGEDDELLGRFGRPPQQKKNRLIAADSWLLILRHLIRPGRASWMRHHLWVTPYAPAERFASGDWPNQVDLRGLAAATSAPGLDSPLPHLHRH